MDKYVGRTFTNTSGREFEVIALDPVRKNEKRVYDIQFKESGYSTKAVSGEINSGLIRDKFEPVIYGVACIGNGSRNHFAYSRWHGMIRRCYDVKYNHFHNYGGAGVRVCNRWLRFDNFLEDITLIEGYDKLGVESGTLHLDKDIKQSHLEKGERIYSLETCMFVTKQENDKHRINNEHLKQSFKAVSPDGDTTIETGIKAFAKREGLNASTVARRVKEKSEKPYKGWVFKSVN